MKELRLTATVLVASDNADDAQQIVRQLSSEFDKVRASADPDTAVEDFEAFKPDVLVLAFDTLEKAQRYHLGLYRRRSGAVRDAHRTVVLCSKAEVRAAFDLCKRDYFDDYVLYWPQNYDGTRLAMSVWNACRSSVAGTSNLPGNAHMLAHARHLADVERVVADPLHATAQALRDHIEPSLAGTRPLAAALQKLRPLVLAVDDDEFSRRLVEKALDPARWEVEFADDATSALRRLRSLRPDVILMDVRLPGMDGVALTRHLKGSSAHAHIPILMMTGDARRETLLQSVEAGAAGFVVKPIVREALEVKLQALTPR